MSKALISFDTSIKDAEELLAYFDAVKKSPPAENAEVLKRAGLIMALTAWETYVEDRVREEIETRLRIVNGSYLGDFVLRRLEDELKRFRNQKTELAEKGKVHALNGSFSKCHIYGIAQLLINP